MTLALLALSTALAPPRVAVCAAHRHDARRATVVCHSATSSDDGDVPTSAGPHLLLVDDQEGMRSAVQRYLSERGFRCSAFGSARDCLNAMGAAPPPDALVTDILMPGDLNGLDLLKTVRADARLCAVPVVLLTAKGMAADRIAGFAAGASAYVSKPFDPEELVAVLRSLTTNAALARSIVLSEEVVALRQEVASVRQLLQTMLQLQGGDAPSQAAPPSAVGAGQEPQAVARAQELVAPLNGARSAANGADGGRRGHPAGSSGIPALTRRERSVLELVGEGMLNKEIAADLGVGVRYVEQVVQRLFEKTGTFNRTSLVRRALQMGLIALDDGPGGRAVSGAARGAGKAQGGRVLTTQPGKERGRLPPGRPRVRGSDARTAGAFGDDESTHVQ